MPSIVLLLLDLASGGHMVVSMRPYRKEDAENVCAITGEFPAAHGTSTFRFKDWTWNLTSSYLRTFADICRHLRMFLIITLDTSGAFCISLRHLASEVWCFSRYPLESALLCLFNFLVSLRPTGTNRSTSWDWCEGQLWSVGDIPNPLRQCEHIAFITANYFRDLPCAWTPFCLVRYHLMLCSEVYFPKCEPATGSR